MYTINIMPEPEVFNGKPMYFWMIEGRSGDNHYNCGHGWSESVAQAAEDSKSKGNPYYKKLVELLEEAFFESDDNFGMPSINQVAEYLIANGVVIQDEN